MIFRYFIFILWLISASAYSKVANNGDINDVILSNADSGILNSNETISDIKNIPKGDYELSALVRLKTYDQRFIAARTPLKKKLNNNELNLSFQNSINFVDKNLNENLNLLEYDEIWIPYVPKFLDRACSFRLSLDAKEEPTGNTISMMSDLEIKSLSQSKSIVLDGGRVLPRSATYLVNRTLGIQNSNDWVYVEEKDANVYMRPFHLDLRNIDSITLSMDSSIKMVNFRVSRNQHSRPSDLLLWEDIPKDISFANGKRLVKLNLASTLKKQMPGSLLNEDPIRIIEVIAFVPKESSLEILSSVPLSNIRANYDSSLYVDDSNLLNIPSRIEGSGEDFLRWRLDLRGLQKKRFQEINFVRGKVYSSNKDCIDSVGNIELISMGNRQVPRIIAQSNESINKLGLPDYSNSSNIHKNLQAKILSSISFENLYLEKNSIHSNQTKSGKIWNSSDGILNVQNTPSAIINFDQFGMNSHGNGTILVTWKKNTPLQPNSYLFIEPIAFHEYLRNVTVTLNFKDGRSIQQPYSIISAISLKNYSGSILSSVEISVSFKNPNDYFSLNKIRIFSIEEVDTGEILKKDFYINDDIGTRKVKIGELEYPLVAPSNNFWRELSTGDGWLELGVVSWEGGKISPAWLGPNVFNGSIYRWKLSSNGRDNKTQSWTIDASKTPLANNSYYLIDWIYYVIIVAILLLPLKVISYVLNQIFSSPIIKYLNIRIKYRIKSFDNEKKIYIFVGEFIANIVILSIFIFLSGILLGLFKYTIYLTSDTLLYLIIISSVYFFCSVARILVNLINPNPSFKLKSWIIARGIRGDSPPIIVYIASAVMIMPLIEFITSSLFSLSSFGFKPLNIFSWMAILVSLVFGFFPWVFPAIMKFIYKTTDILLNFYNYCIAIAGNKISGELILLVIKFLIGFMLYGLILIKLVSINKNSIYITLANIIFLGLFFVWYRAFKQLIIKHWTYLEKFSDERVSNNLLIISSIGLFISLFLLLIRIDYLAINTIAIAYFALFIAVLIKLFEFCGQNVLDR